MNQENAALRIWPSRIGLALATIFWFFSTQWIAAHGSDDPEWNRAIARGSILFATLALLFSLASAQRLSWFGRVGAAVVALMSLWSLYLALSLQS